MEEEKKALDELLFIKKVMQDSQKIIVDNGMGYIVWGLLVTFGMIFGYIKFSLNLQFDYMWAWVILISIGWAFSFFAYYRKKSSRVETFAGQIIARLWLSFGIGMTIIGFIGYYSGAIRGEYISSVIAILLGCAYYLTSVLYEWKWFKLIGIIWWAGGIVMFYFFGIIQFLIMGGLMIFGQVVPGIILYRKYKTQFSDKK
jgi:hypothetical protein